MKVRAHILATALLAGGVVAQTAPASQTVKPNPPQAQAPQKNSSAAVKPPVKSPFKPKTQSAQPSVTQPAKTQAKAVSQPAKTQAAKASTKTQDSSHNAAAKQAPQAQAKAAPKQETTKPAEVKKEATPEVADSGPRKLPSPGKRDPFVSPLASGGARGPGAGCSTGKRCLVVDQLVLKGIVQMRPGNFALVENISKRPYVLHENDSLFNGSVVKITGDSVVFRETSNDILGRPVSKEVVKKVTSPAV